MPPRLPRPAREARGALIALGLAASIGPPRTGRLERGVCLPALFERHRFQPYTIDLGARCGTEALVEAVVGAAERYAALRPEVGVLTLGSMSKRRGGDLPLSMSHNTGRDADIPLPTLDAEGRAVPNRYDHFDALGRAEGGSGRRLDVEATWQLVRYLVLEHRVVLVALAPWLERLVLAHAAARGESPQMLERLAAALCLPIYAHRHDDHLHLRVPCRPGDDRCREEPPEMCR